MGLITGTRVLGLKKLGFEEPDVGLVLWAIDPALGFQKVARGQTADGVPCSVVRIRTSLLPRRVVQAGTAQVKLHNAPAGLIRLNKILSAQSQGYQGQVQLRLEQTIDLLEIGQVARRQIKKPSPSRTAACLPTARPVRQSADSERVVR